MGLPTATTAEMTAVAPATGSAVYNTDDGAVYHYNGTIWVRATDDQNAGEVPLATNVDVNGSGDTPVAETTVEEAIQAIAPITSKAGRVFYPPSIAIDASTNGTGRTVNLYTQYTAQFATPLIRNASAPATIPTYAATDLYYYVTFYDNTVFSNISIDDNGLMTYDIINQPADYNSLINVVFVVKEQ
ncbi:MAG: hypothetical protein HKP24_07520 [Croceitalea sp.]|nr:hypothetical protein [Croceitalea sp.]NNM18408.1 hypothetical protein [Croceitalea sp.]